MSTGLFSAILPIMKEEGTPLLSLRQAAEALGISVTTAKQQAKAGVFRATLVGHQYVVTPSEVERYRREHLGRPGPKPKAT